MNIVPKYYIIEIEIISVIYYFGLIYYRDNQILPYRDYYVLALNNT